MSTFAKRRTKLTHWEETAFGLFVETAHTAYFNIGKEPKKSADLPRQFHLAVKAEQKKALRGGQDVKWAVVESQAGGSHSVLLINDATEALGQYLNPKEAKFGMSFLL